MKLKLSKLTIAPLETQDQVEGGAGTKLNTCLDGCGYTIIWCYTKTCPTQVGCTKPYSKCICPIAGW